MPEETPDGVDSEPSEAAPSRAGVALTEDLIRRKAEHNEGMLSTLEEIALHQLDIDKIEVLNNCRCLKIVYLQNNLISKIEGLHRLKRLEYINLALNNICKIENLERCESLNKLDLTVNFVDMDELHSVGSLRDNSALRELYMTGNPAAHQWGDKYRQYVIATLPQLERLDGVDISRSERIKATQALPALEKELQPLAEAARHKKAQRQIERAERDAHRDARRRNRDNNGDGDNDGDGDGEDEVDEWCPEVRIRDAREARETREKQEAARQKSQRGAGCLDFGQQPERERRFFKPDGTPLLMNTGKWPFAVEDDGTNIRVDLALPKFLDSAQIDADVQPTYLRVTVKKNVFQFILPDEVLADASSAQRSSTTGHLVLTCPKVHPIITSRAPERKQPARPQLKGGTGPAGGSLLGPAERLTGAVDVRSIVASATAAPPKEASERPLGGDWDDEEEVPPLL